MLTSAGISVLKGYRGRIISSLGGAVIIAHVGRRENPATQCIYEYLISKWALVEASFLFIAFTK
jgi:hypothetical protein